MAKRRGRQRGEAGQRADETGPASPPEGVSAKPARPQIPLAPDASITDVSGLSAITRVGDGAIERELQLDENAAALENYFGREQFAELRDLARRAESSGTRGGDRVLILPGIMGSKLGYDVSQWFLDDVIWLNPLAIASGRLKELALNDSHAGKIKPLGVLLFAYLGLKLRLRIAGFDADFHPFDWRKPLAELGRELAAKIASEPRKVKIVAHSMGGLVTRAAFAHAPSNLERVVMLGTPNFGSFAPVQAFRGKNGTVEMVAGLDFKHSSAELAKIFATFPGLLEMIPMPSVIDGGIDLFDPANWPRSGEKPASTALAAARAAQQALPRVCNGVDIIVVAGVNQQTVVNARLDAAADELVYTATDEGDGTVPLQRCILPGVQAYYVEGEHGGLPGHRAIQHALPGLLTTGRTTILADKPPARRSAGSTELRESGMAARRTRREMDTALAGVGDMRRLVRDFALPAQPPGADVLDPQTTGDDAGTAPADAAMGNTVVYSQGRKFRLEIVLARGNITAVDAQCYVLGLFKSVAPSGAARAIDAVMDGAVSNFVSRRMFNGNLGEVTILPNGRHPMRANYVAFVGLGAIDGFAASQLEMIGENMIRTFVAGRVDDFAVVPLGGASGVNTSDAVRNLLIGFMRGLRDADTKGRFRTITICEKDPARYQEICTYIRTLAHQSLFEDVELTLSYLALPETIEPEERRGGLPKRTDAVYLIVREGAGRVGQDGGSAGGSGEAPALVGSVLTAGSQATIVSGRQSGTVSELDAQLARLGSLNSNAVVGEVGDAIGSLVLAPQVREVLATRRGEHLVVVHDSEASRIPWETIPFGQSAGSAPGKEAFPALGKGISHRYEAANLSVAKWLEQRQLGGNLRILIVADPLGTDARPDLPNALREGAALERLVKGNPGLECMTLFQEAARKSEIRRLLQSGSFDVIHYAGHAFFDPADPGRSGIICAGGEILSGEEISTIGSFPCLMFVNACEAARIRTYMQDGTRTVVGGPKTRSRARAMRHELARRSIGFAEALLRGGVANYIGTYWPVADDAAGKCAQIVYPLLLEGRTINDALCEARGTLFDDGHPDWANYIFYGDPDFRLKVVRDGA